MRKASIAAVVIAVLIALTSCATVMGKTSPVGKWSFSNGTDTTNLLLSTGGTYVIENGNDCTMGTFTFDDKCIYFNGSTAGESYFLNEKEKQLKIGSTVYERKTFKVFDLSSNIQGVWTLDGSFPAIAFTSDGTFLSYKTDLTENSFGSYVCKKNKLIADLKETSYLILDDCLYIQSWEILGNTKTIKYTRMTEKGNDKSELYLTLLPGIPYVGEAGQVNYTFNADKTFTSAVDGNILSEGTYTYNGYLAELSDGTSLTFMVIDDLPLGYIL